MTCIVGHIDKGVVTLGADSAGVGGYTIEARRDPKLFRVGDFIIGCTSSFRMIQLLNFSLELPLVGDTDIYKYMCTSFVTAVRECFAAGGYLRKESEREEGGTFLVGYRDRLFCVQDDFQVAELECPYNAIGSGEEYAKGALHAVQGVEIGSSQKVKVALEAAAHHSNAVCPPFRFLNTQKE